MFTASFFWKPGEYDEDFHRLNGEIEAVAESLPGYRGVEAWDRSDDSGVRQATYYWDSMETLREFAGHPVHREAKRRYAEWYKGYHVVIGEVLKKYGDGGVDQITAERND